MTLPAHHAPAATARIRAASLVLGLLSASYVVLRTGRDTLYLSEGGLFGLPFAYVGQALLSIPLGLAVSWFLPRVGLRRVRLASVFATVLTACAYAVLARPGATGWTTLLFLSVPLVYSVAFR